MAKRWYDVCDDYSLEERFDVPDTAFMQVCEVEGGTAYAFDFEEEGPIFFSCDNDVNGCYLGGFE